MVRYFEKYLPKRPSHLVIIFNCCIPTSIATIRNPLLVLHLALVHEHLQTLEFYFYDLLLLQESPVDGNTSGIDLIAPSSWIRHSRSNLDLP